MQTMFARVCGLDVHKARLTACARLVVDGVLSETIESFGTTTSDLLALRDWLKAHEVTHVAMESTGVYWKCIYYVLEDEFDCLLVNATHIKHVPGRKTDTIDAAWIAQLLACGLLRKSLVAPKPIRELRDLTRYRKALIYERSRAVNRLHKLLEDAGVKLSCVATDVMGVSGRAMMRALIDGTLIPTRSRSSRRASCARSCPSCARRSRVASAPTTHSCSSGCSRTSQSSRTTSQRSPGASRSRSPLSSRRVIHLSQVDWWCADGRLRLSGLLRGAAGVVS